jgi:hypothetical protein
MSTDVLNEEVVTDNVETSNVADSTVSAPTTPDLSAVAAEMGVDEDVVKDFYNNDENFAKLVKGEAGDTGGEEDNAPDDNKSGEDSVADGETKDEPKTEADDKNSGDAGDESFELADDVIKGLKGTEMAKLSPEAQAALADYHADMQAKARAVEEYDAKLKALFDDPVIRQRAGAIEAGRPADLQVRGMTAQESSGIIKAIQDKLALDDDDAQEIVAILGNGIELIAKDMAQDLANRHIVASDAQRREAEISKQGNEIMLSLSQFNKDLAVNEKDLANFWTFVNGKPVMNETHPEIEKYKNGLHKVAQWGMENGFDYKTLVKMGAEPFYAAYAAANKIPVTFNTGERDKNIAAAARKKALEPFLKAKSSGTLNVQGSVGDRDKAAKTLVNGVDIERLVTDHDYHRSQVDKCWGDPVATEKLEALFRRGTELLTKKAKM